MASPIHRIEDLKHFLSYAYLKIDICLLYKYIYIGRIILMYISNNKVLKARIELFNCKYHPKTKTYQHFYSLHLNNEVFKLNGNLLLLPQNPFIMNTAKMFKTTKINKTQK